MPERGQILVLTGGLAKWNAGDGTRRLTRIGCHSQDHWTGAFRDHDAPTVRRVDTPTTPHSDIPEAATLRNDHTRTKKARSPNIRVVLADRSERRRRAYYPVRSAFTPPAAKRRSGGAAMGDLGPALPAGIACPASASWYRGCPRPSAAARRQAPVAARPRRQRRGGRLDRAGEPVTKGRQAPAGSRRRAARRRGRGHRRRADAGARARLPGGGRPPRPRCGGHVHRHRHCQVLSRQNTVLAGRQWRSCRSARSTARAGFKTGPIRAALPKAITHGEIPSDASAEPQAPSDWGRCGTG